MNPDVDLGAFARSAPEVRPPRRRWLRIVVPLVLVLGFAGVLLSSLGGLFTEAVPVTVVRPVPSEGGVGGGEVLFQAAGWVEPDPFPIRVTPLAAGVVKEVLVQQSDLVEAGAPVARLVDDDAKLALAAAEAALALAAADRDRARAESSRARESFDAALEITESVAMWEAEARGKQAESVHRAQAVVKAEALHRLAVEELALQEHLAAEKAAGPRQVEIARAKVDETRGEVAIMKADAALAAAEAEKAEVRKTRALRERELRTEEHLRVEKAGAELASADAKVQDATVKRDEAKLRLDRMTVRAPVAGVVLARLAVPGMAVTPEGADATAICTLFDPKEIRVRVDVPQSEVGKAAPGLDATIISQTRRDRPYHGKVLRVVQEADINKVTLQVHVRVLDPDEFLRPEMLCTVSVIAPATAPSTGAGIAAVKVPSRVVENGSVWVVDATTSTAVRRSIKAGATSAEWVEVLAGLNLSDKVIDDGRGRLEDGTPVKVRERN